MNYVRELNAFYDWLESNPCSTGIVALWFVLMAVNNKAGWKQDFTVANLTLQAKTGLSRKQLERCRQSLIDRGRILYRKSNKANEAGIYRMVKFDAQDDALYDARQDARNDAPDVHRMTHESSTLVKQKENETKPVSVDVIGMTENEFQTEVEIRMQICTNNFQYRLIDNDYSAYLKLRTEKVDRQFILDGINEAFTAYSPKHSMDTITKFSYCAKRILGRWTAQQGKKELETRESIKLVASASVRPANKPQGGNSHGADDGFRETESNFYKRRRSSNMQLLSPGDTEPHL